MNSPAAALARHEVPGQILIVGELPRNPTGKVIKRMLLPLFGAVSAACMPGDEAAVEFDDVGRRIARVWSRVFGGTIPAGADFFAAGGDSLRASQLAVLVRDEFGLEVPGSFAFDLPAQAMQAAWLRTETARVPDAEAGQRSDAEVGQWPESVGSPLTGVQEHWWRWLNEVPGTRQMPPVHMALRIRDRLDLEALDRALVDLAVRHDALRSVVLRTRRRATVGEAGRARVLLLVKRMAEGPDALGAPRARRRDGCGRGPDAPSTSPLARCSGRWRSWSIPTTTSWCSVSTTSCSTAGPAASCCATWPGSIRRASAARASTAPSPALGFHDFVLADRGRLVGLRQTTGSGLWTERPRSSQRSLAGWQEVIAVSEGAQVSVPLDPSVATLLGQLARDYRMSVSMVVAAAWGSVLALWSGSDDLVLAQPVSGRIRPEYGDVIGCLFRWTFIRIRMDHAASLETALQQVRAAVLAGSDHQFLDYGRYHRQVRHPAYVRFESWGRPAHLPGLVSEHFDIPAGPNMRWPLAPGDPDSYPPELLVSQGEDGALTATLIFNALAYEADDISRLAERASLAWTAMASAPTVTLRDLDGPRWLESAIDVE